MPQDHWYYEYIEKLRGLEITSGVGDGQFGLGQTVTRAEFVAFLCKLMGWKSK
ncbi:S-layer homology domain-containing protein [Anaerosphaera multitolerans]|uniref:S-layer homology domain-containing protein n=1 Tax=Anaerosphaera multitolerans TaxID=2487351 RepID=A0A437S5Y9_9FIRM|nr:S-layer homology domain-containing protein [Anaerosphaera multitolerans]RVU54430.1 S-layer homology domain-containing protein [Anaerosphaera multitolerans]